MVKRMARGYPPPDLKALFERITALNQQFRDIGAGVAALNQRFTGTGRQFKGVDRQFKEVGRLLRSFRPDPEFVAIWHFFEELQKRDPEAARLLGGYTPREMYRLRLGKVLRLPPRPRGRPAGKRQRDIEAALDALAGGHAVPGSRRRRKYIKRLSTQRGTKK